MVFPPLFKLYPELNGNIPFLSLGKFPTRVHRLVTIGDVLGYGNLWIKRDDESGELYGGNKVRKLEYLLADAKCKGKDTLIVFGAMGSNHVLATTLYGKSLSFKVIALLLPQPLTERAQKNFQLISQLADEYHLLSTKTAIPIALSMLNQAGSKTAFWRRLYYIPIGGSSPLSCLGYVNAIFELKEQIAAGIAPEPDYMFVALGSCGTMAGLELSIQLAGLKSKLIGVRVVDRIAANASTVARLANRTLRIFQKYRCHVPDIKVKRRQINLLYDCFGRGYAVPTKEAIEAVELMEKYEDIRLEYTYTGKTLAGLIRYVQEKKIEDKVILFWNTYDSVGREKGDGRSQSSRFTYEKIQHSK